MEVRDSGFGTVMRCVMRDCDISTGAKALYAYLCSFAGAKKTCYPTRKLICGELGICEQTLSGYIRELLSRHIIIRHQEKGKGRFKNNVYTVDAQFTRYEFAVDDFSADEFSADEFSVNEFFVDEKLETNINNTNINNKNNNNSKTKNSNNNNSNKEEKSIFLKMIKGE